MPMQVCMGATLQCSFGLAPSILVVTPENKVLSMTPKANIMDHIPMKNIMPFGMCSTPSNPAVDGDPPAPCVPVIPSPWIPGAPTVLIGNMPALNDTSTLMCAYGGVITVTSAGQTTVQIP